MLITMVTAKAQPGGGGGWQDSTDYPDFRVMQFMMDVNEEFEMDYSFMQWQLAGLDSSLIEPEVTYELVYGSPFSSQQFLQPTGMTITEEGVVNWTPTVAGNYYFGVQASLSDIPEETVLIGNVIRVTPGQVQRCAKIVGQLTMPVAADSMQNFRFAQIVALPIQGEQNTMTPYYGDMRANGTYRINVPAGSYKVAIHFMNTVKFYPNANNVSDAEVLTVACPDSVVANMTITNEDLPDIVYFTTYPQGFELNAGEIGTYDAEAVSSQGNVVNYRIPDFDYEIDENVTVAVDAQTGIATFSATTRGRHYFMIEAYVPGDSLAREIQTVSFWVRGNQNPNDSVLCAKIHGTVTVNSLTDSARVRGIVYVLPIIDGEIIDTPSMRPFVAEIGENGNYAMRVPAGDYKIAVKYMNVRKFYPNTLNEEEAEVITLACNDSLIANFTISNEDMPEMINFTTNPQGYELNAGEVATYDADAVSSQGNTVNYRLIPSNSMNDEDITVEINAETGVATFSATTRGRHYFGIEAFVVGDSTITAFQYVTFFVRGNQEPNDSLMCAYIRGTVTMNTIADSSYVRGMVYALPVFNENEPNTPGMRSYMTEIEEDGSYRVRVPAGDYKLLFYSEMCEPKFYENSNDYETATVITAICGDTTNSYDITLDPYTPPVTYTVSGRVFSEANNEGLRAVVYLFLNNEYDNPTDSTDFGPEEGILMFDGSYGDDNCNSRMIAIETNQDGTYSVELPEGLSFKAFAKPRNTRMFVGEFYNNTANMEDAELITLTENRSGVDFGLARFVEEPESQFNISGKVKDEANTNVLAMVTLIRKPGDSENANSYKFVNMATDTLGNYNFANVKQGTYILFAMPVNRPLLPGFFVASAPATWNWENATEIVVPAANGVMPTVQYDITLRNITDASGAGRVAGRIERSMGSVINFGKASGATSGVNGVLVTIYDANNKPVKYAHTDDNGDFDFEKLGFGEFTLKASKIGFGSKTTTVAIDAQNLTQTASLFMDEKTGTSGVEEMNNNQFTVFPNPVQTVANINFNASTEGNAVLTISDMSGRDVITNYKTVVNGSNSIQIDAKDLTSGLYLVKIRLNNSEFQTLMNVIK